MPPVSRYTRFQGLRGKTGRASRAASVATAVLRVAALLTMILVLPRPAAAQVDGTIWEAGPSPFVDSPYVHLYVSGWWDTTVWCGIDGGCQDVWCDADGAGIGILGDDGAYVSHSADPGAGWTDIGLEDYTPPDQMQDVTSTRL